MLYETVQTLLHQQRYFSLLSIKLFKRYIHICITVYYVYFLISYRENAIRMSQLMQDEIMPGREVAVYWIEHVLRHGGTKHLQNRAKHLPFYQRHLLDVWLLLTVILAISIFINYKILHWIMRKTKTTYYRKIKTQ